MADISGFAIQKPHECHVQHPATDAKFLTIKSSQIKHCGNLEYHSSQG
jgi:hypothetical protein